MKPINIILGLSLIAAVLFTQTGCALVTAPRVAVAVGKVVYEKVKDDKAKNESQK
jgi:hypothetical protein